MLSHKWVHWSLLLQISVSWIKSHSRNIFMINKLQKVFKNIMKSQSIKGRSQKQRLSKNNNKNHHQKYKKVLDNRIFNINHLELETLVVMLWMKYMKVKFVVNRLYHPKWHLLIAMSFWLNIQVKIMNKEENFPVQCKVKQINCIVRHRLRRDSLSIIN